MILNVFSKAWEWLDKIISKIGFDDIFINLFDKYIRPMHDLFKWLLLLLLVIIIILGTISLIKKTFKLFIVIAVIVIAIIVFTTLK